MSRPITVSLATMPKRAAWAERVVTALRPQCDALHVALNHFPADAAEAFAASWSLCENVSARVGAGPAAEKFAPMTALRARPRGHRGYLLTVDDDINYPADYVARMVCMCSTWSGRAVVTAHASLLVGEPQSIADYVWQSSFTRESDGAWCTLPGTGVMCMDLDALPEEAMRDLLPSLTPDNADDATFGAWAQRWRIPIRLVPRSRGWLSEIDPHHDGLWQTCVDRTAPIIAGREWRLHAIPARFRIGEEPLTTGGRPKRSIAKAVTQALSEHRAKRLADARERSEVADAVVSAVRDTME